MLRLVTVVVLVVVSTVGGLAVQNRVQAKALVKTKVSLASLPSRHELDPNLFDETGCAIPGPGDPRICPTPPDPGFVYPQDTKEENHAKIARSGRGFEGPHYASEVSLNNISIIGETVSATTSGQWKALGLVRNEFTTDVGHVSVTASLYGADGRFLEKVTGSVPVGRIRPGEPAPFAVTATVNATTAGRVEWSAEAGAPAKAERDFLIYEYYEQPLVRGVRPYILATGMKNLGHSLKEARLVVAWLDQTGKVAWIATTTNPDRGIGAGDTFNMSRITISDFALAEKLVGLPHMMWAVGE